MTEYKKVFVDEKQNRWVYLDDLGNKDTITLFTKSGKLITRTCQYYSNFYIHSSDSLVEKVKISYKGRYYFVTKDTILED